MIIQKMFKIIVLYLIIYSLISPTIISATDFTTTPDASSDTLYVIVTIDTEGFYGKHPLKNMIWGEVDNSGMQYGIPMIMDICDKHGVKATFFVDVYEYRLQGEEKMRNVCKYIKDRGFDAQLHTHPAVRPDPVKRPKVTKGMYNYDPHCWNKERMRDYDLENQSAILEEGKELLMKWIGEEPVAHRAGGYAANYDTLEALRENSIFVDSSMFYLHPHCDLNYPVLTHNKVVKYQNVIEVPVSVFKRIWYLKVGSLRIKVGEDISKVDIDWASLDELKSSLEAFKQLKVRTVILFLHSYTFVKWDSDFSQFSIDQEDIEKFDQILDEIEKDPKIRVITMKEFYDLYQKDPKIFEGSDYIPEITVYDSYWQVMRKAINAAPESIKADIFISTNLVIYGVCTYLVMFGIKRYRRKYRRGKKA